MLPIFIPLVFGLSLAAAPAVAPVVAPIVAAAAFTAVAVAAPVVAATAAVVVAADVAAANAGLPQAPIRAANEPLEAKIDVVRTEDGRILLSSSKTPADECLAQANSFITKLLPHAEALAGAPLDVTRPDAVFTGQSNLPSDTLAAWNSGLPGAGSLVIFTDFCRTRAAADQKATIAHELGHAVDHFVFTGRDVGDGDYSTPWETRRREIAATAWAIAIYQRAGLPVAELESHFGHRPHDYWVAVQAYSTSHSK